MCVSFIVSFFFLGNYKPVVQINADVCKNLADASRIMKEIGVFKVYIFGKTERKCALRKKIAHMCVFFAAETC